MSEKKVQVLDKVLDCAVTSATCAHAASRQGVKSTLPHTTHLLEAMTVYNIVCYKCLLIYDH